MADIQTRAGTQLWNFIDTDSAPQTVVPDAYEGASYIYVNNGTSGNKLTLSLATAPDVELEDGQRADLFFLDSAWQTPSGSTGGGGANTVIDVVAGEDLLAFEPFYIASDGLAYKASNALESTATAVGMVPTDTLSGIGFQGVTFGVVDATAHGYTKGTQYYVGNPTDGDYITKTNLDRGDISCPAFIPVNDNDLFLSYGPTTILEDPTSQVMIPAGEAMSKDDPYYIGSDGKAYKANNNVDGEQYVKGLVPSSVILDDVFDGVTFGTYTSTAHGFTVGEEYYLGNDADGNFLLRGNVSSSHKVVYCFTPLDVDTLFLRFSNPEEDAKDRVIGEIFQHSAPYELTGCAFLDYRTLSQSVYGELFSMIGHLYAKSATDATTAEGSGLFHIPDGNFNFARIGRSLPLNFSSIDTSTDQITITGHGWATDGSVNGRAIKLQRTPGSSPTMCTGTGYTEYNQNYLRVIDVNTIELYDNEANAIDTSGTTGRIDWLTQGDGVYLLTTQGCYQADQANSIDKLYAESGGSPTVGEISISDDGTRSDELLLLAGGSTRNLSASKRGVETRGAYASLGMQIKLIGVSASTGETYDASVIEVDLGQQADFTNTSIPVTHNLGVPSRQVFKNMEISDDGINWVQPGNFDHNNSGYQGFNFEPNDDNSFNLVVGAAGITVVDGTTQKTFGDGTYLRFWLVKADLFARSYDPQDPIAYDDYEYTITENTNGNVITIDSSVTTQKTITLSKGSLASISNRVKIYNKSGYSGYHLVTDGTTIFWLYVNQTSEYYFDGSDLIVGHGKELIYLDYSNTGNLSIATDLPKWEWEEDYIFVYALGTKTNVASLYVRMIEADSLMYSNESYSSAYIRVNWSAASPDVISTNNASYDIKEVWKVHN